MHVTAQTNVLDGKYEIVRFLGQGAWATVYEGINLRIKRRVAIKILGAELAAKPESLERFEREARAATQITSPNVVDVFDLGMLPDGRPYMVMELLEGEDLGARLTKGPLTEERAVYFVAQALRGLADAHAAGVLHRDIKPDNVVIVKSKDGDEIVKIVDFGISKFGASSPEVVSMTQTNAVLGSPVYMSPEQCRGARHMDQRSDIFSLGTVLFEALTGTLPYTADSFNELMFKIALEDAPDPKIVKPDMDPDLAWILRKALARDPAERWQTANDFQAALVDWAELHGHDPAGWPTTSLRNRKRPPGVGTGDPMGAVTGASMKLRSPFSQSTSDITSVRVSPRRSRTLLLAGVGAALALVAVGVFVVPRASTRPAHAGSSQNAPVVLAAASPAAVPPPKPVAPAEARSDATSTTTTTTATTEGDAGRAATPSPRARSGSVPGAVAHAAAPAAASAPPAAAQPAVSQPAAANTTVLEGRTIHTTF